MSAKIKTGDTVEVMTGRDAGAKGKVLEVYPSEDRLTVEGVNVQKVHVRPGTRQNMPQGGIMERPGKIHVSNVRLYSERLGAAVRVGFEIDENGNKTRVARGGAHAGQPVE